MDVDQQARMQRKYFKRAEGHLLKRARWLKRHRTGLTHPADQHKPLTKTELAQIKSALAHFGINYRPSRQRRPRRRLAEFAVDAPNQPRGLDFESPINRDGIKPLRMQVQVNGFMPSCNLYYAGYSFEANSLWRQGIKHFSRVPEADASRVVDLLQGIIEHRYVLVRYVVWWWYGHSDGVYYRRSKDIVLEADTVDQLPEPLDQAIEAIIYTWSGDGDRRVEIPGDKSPPKC